ncbi:MAG: hypothetical protein VX913_04335 [Planctomycetota bacterium]|nr:hypothetical protein [Planctomycetota bacterium]MEE2711982.1 hypothetical protein [Planctomycetota bacterium]
MDLTLIDLWLPILASAVAVFTISSLFHLVIGRHRHDWKPVGDEDALMDLLRGQGVAAGMYTWPHCADPKNMDEAFMTKFAKGPSGVLTVHPTGPFSMGAQLAKWFGFSLSCGVVAAYICTATAVDGSAFMPVFQIAGAVSFVCYSWSGIMDSIWKGVPWAITVSYLIDGLIYGLATGAAFGLLWPSA